MGARCKVVRGLVKEVEQEINKFLSTHSLRVLHLAQSETHNHITLTLLFDDLESEHPARVGKGREHEEDRQ